MTELRALILDVEGLICHPDVRDADAELARRWPGVTWERVNHVRNLPAGYDDWLHYSVGAMDGDLYWRHVLEALDCPADEGAVADLRAVMRRVWWAVVDSEVLALAADARAAGFRLGLLSNSAPEHEGRIGLLEPLVDASHFSHRTGRRKPDAAAYHAIAAELGLAAGECLFVDDKRRNVDAAILAGMSAVTFTSAEQLAGELAARGIAAGTPIGGRTT